MRQLIFFFICSILLVGIIYASIIPEELVKISKKSLLCGKSGGSNDSCSSGYATEAACIAAACRWSPVVDDKIVYECVCPLKVSTGYVLTNFKSTSSGYSGLLSLNGNGTTTYGDDIKQLSLDVFFESESTLRVKITDAKLSRYEVPQSILPRTDTKIIPKKTDIKFSHKESPFSFEITRISDGKSLFKLGDSFTFKDQYLEIPTSIDTTAKTFGLGESTRMNHALTPGTYTLWNLDLAAADMNQNLYGSYPYYMQVINGQAHGVMLMNSNGMDVVLQESTLIYKAIGGIVDLYFFAGPSPAQVTQQYLAIVGKPIMMPYWSLGFHNCRWGYKSVAEVEEVVANYSASGIPLETQWMDIDYMQDYQDFTLDSVNFPVNEVKSFVNRLHENKQHFVPIIDPGIFVPANTSDYDAYTQGIALDLFIKDIQGGYYMGQVWPGSTYFPDFLHPSTQDYWTNQLKGFYDKVPVDGIWIDMNEVSNFCNNNGAGQVCANTVSSGCTTSCCCETVDANNTLDFPPYKINNAYGLISTRTVAASATQYGDLHVYNTHNLYGLTEQIATNNAMTTIRDKRPFVLSRSSFISTGKHSAKWTGDNAARWTDLKSSIVSIMDFNLFGVPMIGADICGFNRDTTEELCARWIEVGAFYTFSRNHNANGAASQELYLWETVTTAAKNALNMRYQLLPVLYTLFYEAQLTGVAVIRSLWYDQPNDQIALGIDSQFMWGSSVLISPVLEQGAVTVNAYFPTGLWYAFSTDRTQRGLAVDASAGGVYKSLDTPLTAVNVHIKGGRILPLTDSAMTIAATRESGFTLLVALCPGGQATGELFWDDGEQVTLTDYTLVKYSAVVRENGAGLVSAVVEHNSYADSVLFKIKAVQVLGLSTQIKQQPKLIKLNGKALDVSTVQYNVEKSSLYFSGLNVVLSEAMILTWS